MKRIPLFAALLMLTTVSVAQTRDLSQSQANYAAYYSYYESGDLTIRVSTWGGVRFPGLYEIPRGTTLEELFSLSGGPQLGDRQRRSRREMTIELLRTTNGVREVLFSQTMEDDIAAIEQNPILQDGDVLTVQSVSRRTFSVRDIFPILSAALTTVILIDNLSN